MELRRMSLEQDFRTYSQCLDFLRLRIGTPGPADFTVLIHKKDVRNVLVSDTQVVSDITKQCQK